MWNNVSNLTGQTPLSGGTTLISATKSVDQPLASGASNVTISPWDWTTEVSSQDPCVVGVSTGFQILRPCSAIFWINTNLRGNARVCRLDSLQAAGQSTVAWSNLVPDGRLNHAGGFSAQATVTREFYTVGDVVSILVSVDGGSASIWAARTAFSVWATPI